VDLTWGSKESRGWFCAGIVLSQSWFCEPLNSTVVDTALESRTLSVKPCPSHMHHDGWAMPEGFLHCTLPLHVSQLDCNMRLHMPAQTWAVQCKVHVPVGADSQEHPDVALPARNTLRLARYHGMLRNLVISPCGYQAYPVHGRPM
jgi:hypothetical protein